MTVLGTKLEVIMFIVIVILLQIEVLVSTK